MAGCRPTITSLLLATAAIGLSYYSAKTTVAPVDFQGIVEYLAFVFAGAASVTLLPVMVSYTSKSPILGAVTAYASSVFAREIVPGLEYLALGVAVLLLFMATRVRPRDSALEYLLAGDRFYLSPVLGALAAALAAGPLTKHPYYYTPNYWVMVIAGAAIASRISTTPPRALASAIAAAAAPWGTIVLLWASSFLPLPAPQCSGARIGIVLAVEGEASPARLYLRSGKTSRGLVCVEKFPAKLDVRPGSIVWVYTSEPSKLVARIAGAVAESSVAEPLIMDFDAQGHAGLSDVEAVIRDGRGFLALSSLRQDEKRLALAMAEPALPKEVVLGISWCNPDWDALVGFLREVVGEKRKIVVAACSPPPSSTTPVKSPERTLLVVTYTGDPAETAGIISRLLGDEASVSLAREMSKDRLQALVSPYCSSLAALVRLEDR